jgi:hypothetical protein
MHYDPFITTGTGARAKPFTTRNQCNPVSEIRTQTRAPAVADCTSQDRETIFSSQILYLQEYSLMLPWEY